MRRQQGALDRPRILAAVLKNKNPRITIGTDLGGESHAICLLDKARPENLWGFLLFTMISFQYNINPTLDTLGRPSGGSAGGVRTTMRNLKTFTLLLSAVCLLGCKPSVSSRPVAPTPTTAVPDFQQRVGQRIVLEGIVTHTKCPQVLGVDAWELEDFRGQRVRVSGILRQSVITAADIDPMVANRGPGTFYSLEDMKYEILK